MIQLQFLNYLLSSKDASLISLHNLSEKYFSEYRNEFTFIKTHIDRYGNVPDLTTFVAAFPDFEIITVNEAPTYLLDELFKDYRTKNMAETFNKVRSLLLEGKTDEAASIYSAGAEALSQDVAITCVDLFKDTSRYDDYIERTHNLDKYYISTGFRELDKVIGGIDMQEELGVIMARTNLGKSWISLKMATAAASALV